MNMKTLIGIILVIGGVLGIAGAVSADYTGLNVTQKDKDCKDFGWCQLAASAAGGAMALGGIVFVFVSKKPGDAPEGTEPAEEEAGEDRETAPAGEKSPPAKAAEQKTRGDAVRTEPRSQTTPQPQSAAQDTAQTQDDAQAPDKDGLDALATDLGLDLGSRSECPDCGGSLPKDARSCPTCGADFEEAVVDLEDTEK